MNAFKELKLFYNGIKGTIDHYTSDSNIINVLEQLQIGMDNNDYAVISCMLDELVKWYENNIYQISSNDFVFNIQEHRDNFDRLKSIKERITEEDCIEVSTSSMTNRIEKNDEKLIFISHSSADKKYGDALRKFLVGLGIKDNQIIYTSHPMNKIPLDKNIYEYLKEHINSNILMIFLWSNEYLKSPACMNEMGAAWIMRSDYTNIYVPTFDFTNPDYYKCAVDTNKMGAVLNYNNPFCRTGMLELKDKVIDLFDLNVEEKQVMYLLDEFISDITPKE